MDISQLQVQEARRQMHFQRIWLLAYVALFSALLAFFIIMISMVELEGVTEKRAHQQLTQQLYVDVRTAARKAGLTWLKIENDFPKGVRVYPDPDHFSIPLFAQDQAQISLRYRGYVRAMGQLLRDLGLADFRQRYGHFNQQIEARGYQVHLTVRVEGHAAATDASDPKLRQRQVELSVFRAYNIMHLLQQDSLLPDAFWGIAGYGPWHPLFEDPKDPRNHRVEVFLQPQMMLGAGHGKG